MSESSFVLFDKMWAEKWSGKLSQNLLVGCEAVFGKPLHSELSDRGVLFVAVQVLCALLAPPGKSRTNDTWTHSWLSLLTNQAEFGNLEQLRAPSRVWLFWTMAEAPEQRASPISDCLPHPLHAAQMHVSYLPAPCKYLGYFRAWIGPRHQCLGPGIDPFTWKSVSNSSKLG